MQILDSPSKNSYIGSYYQPPDRIPAMPVQLEFPARTSTSSEPQIGSPQLSLAQNNLDSRGKAYSVFQSSIYLSPFATRISCLCSCCRCPENPPAENQAVGAGKEASREELPAVFPQCSESSSSTGHIVSHGG